VHYPPTLNLELYPSNPDGPIPPPETGHQPPQESPQLCAVRDGERASRGAFDQRRLACRGRYVIPAPDSARDAAGGDRGVPSGGEQYCDRAEDRGRHRKRASDGVKGGGFNV